MTVANFELAFMQYHFQNVPVRAVFSKSTIFKSCWQNNVPFSCEREAYPSHFSPFSNSAGIDLLAILQKSLDRALFLYISIREVRSSGVRASITIMHIRKFLKLHHSIVRF